MMKYKSAVKPEDHKLLSLIEAADREAEAADVGSVVVASLSREQNTINQRTRLRTQRRQSRKHPLWMML